MDKRLIMIHEMDEKTAKSLLSVISPTTDILFWDDALFSQYVHLPKFSNFLNVIGVSSGITSEATEQRKKKKPTIDIDCIEARKNYNMFNDATPYMTWDDIKSLLRYKVIIAAHGHYHRDLRKISSTPSLIRAILKKINYMRTTFTLRLGYYPKVYIFPYNYENPMMKSLLSTSGITNFYGKNRIPVQDIIVS